MVKRGGEPVHHRMDYRKQSHHMIGAIRCVQKHRECRRDDRWGERIMMCVRHPRKIRGELKKITRKHDEPDDPTPTHECRGLRRRQVGRRCVRLCADLTVPAKTEGCIRRNKNRLKNPTNPTTRRHLLHLKACRGVRWASKDAVFGCGRVLKTKIEVWRRVVGCQVGLRKYFIFPILPSQLIDGRKDTLRFIVSRGKLPQ